MNHLQKAVNQKHEIIISIIITLSAFLIRFGALIFFYEETGDGPTRATWVYIWSKAPFWLTHGVWLPGYYCLSGLFSCVINNPLISTRILHMILGSLTILFFYLLVRSLYDRFIALLSALILTFFPLHIGLSVTSLAEVSVLFEIITGTFFVILASENHNNKRVLYIFLSLLMLCLSIMTRYESWIFIPFFPCFYFWKTKRKVESTMIFLILIIFPILWMLTNYHYTGNLLPGYDAALKDTKPESLIRALFNLGKLTVSYMWWILPIMSVLGLLFNLILALRKRLKAKQVLYFLIVCINSIFIIKFAMDRGQTFGCRYILFNLILILPFAAYSINQFFHNSNKLILIFVVLVLVVSPMFSQLIYKENIYLRRSHPQYIIDVANWLKSSAYRTDYIIFTKMNWDATLLPLYFPEISPRQIIVSSWTSDQELQNYVNNNKPSLLVFREGDEKYKLRIEKILNEKIIKENLVKKIGKVHIYEIKDIFY